MAAYYPLQISRCKIKQAEATQKVAALQKEKTDIEQRMAVLQKKLTHSIVKLEQANNEKKAADANMKRYKKRVEETQKTEKQCGKIANVEDYVDKVI